jgi:hypothetical protein
LVCRWLSNRSKEYAMARHTVYGRCKPLALVLVLYLVGCASGLNVETSIEPDGTVIDRMVNNQIGIEGEGEYSDYAMGGSTMNLVGVDQYCYLNASRHRELDGTTTYFLEFSYTGPRELYIERRKSLELVINGATPVVLIGQGETAREQDKMNKTFVESFRYLIPVHELVNLSDAKEVGVIVTGRDFVLNGFFVENNFNNYKKFVKDYVE